MVGERTYIGEWWRGRIDWRHYWIGLSQCTEGKIISNWHSFKVLSEVKVIFSTTIGLTSFTGLSTFTWFTGFTRLTSENLNWKTQIHISPCCLRVSLKKEDFWQTLNIYYFLCIQWERNDFCKLSYFTKHLGTHFSHSHLTWVELNFMSPPEEKRGYI